MIKLKDVEILDLLPYTFKRNPRYNALSKAIKTMFDVLYNQNSKLSFWADINNAVPEVLDSMAVELAAPFYFTNMPDDQKRTIIATAFTYNSQIGTVGAVQSILNAAFGGGEITEWFDYDGEPYHFKLNLPIDFGNKFISKETIENFYKMLEKEKNKRSKLDEFTIKAVVDFVLHFLLVLSRTACTSIVSYELPIAVKAECSPYISVSIIEHPKKITVYPAHGETAGYEI